jgi:hypothetical protein
LAINTALTASPPLAAVSLYLNLPGVTKILSLSPHQAGSRKNDSQRRAYLSPFVEAQFEQDVTISLLRDAGGGSGAGLR